MSFFFIFRQSRVQFVHKLMNKHSNSGHEIHEQKNKSVTIIEQLIRCSASIVHIITVLWANAVYMTKNLGNVHAMVLSFARNVESARKTTA